MKKTQEQILELLPKTKESGIHEQSIIVNGSISQLMKGADPYSVLDEVLIYVSQTEKEFLEYYHKTMAQSLRGLKALQDSFPAKGGEA